MVTRNSNGFLKLISWLAPQCSGFHSSLARGAQINFLASNRFPLKMRSHIFSNFGSSNHHQSQIIQVLMTTCNHSISLRGTCSSIMIFFIFRNNPTKGQTGSGIYTSDGVTFKNILVTIFHISILLRQWPRQIAKKWNGEKSQWKESICSACLTRCSPPSSTPPSTPPDYSLPKSLWHLSGSPQQTSHLSILKKKSGKAERQRHTENAEQTVLFHWDPR